MNYDDMKKLVKGKNEFSSIAILPDEMKYDIHVFLEKNFSEEDIINQLKTKYGPTHPYPDAQELREYKKLYRGLHKALNFSSVKDTLNKYFPNFDTLLNKVSIDSMYSFKEVLMKEMIVKCLNRMKRIEKAASDGDKVNVNQEKIILDYIDEIKTIMDMLMKLEADAQKDKTYIVSLISSELQPLLDAVKQTVNQVCPEKAEEFKLVFKERLGKAVFQFDGQDKLLDNSSASESLTNLDVVQGMLKDTSDEKEEAERKIIETTPLDELPYDLQAKAQEETDPVTDQDTDQDKDKPNEEGTPQ